MVVLPSCSPPQVWHVKVLDTKHLREVLQLVRPKGLGENVGNLPTNSNIPNFDFTAQDPLAHKVIMQFSILHVSMEYRVLGQLHATDVVAVHQNRSGNFEP